MASTEQHLAAALRLNKTYFNYEGNDLKEYLIGALACDAPKLKKNTGEQKKLANNIKKISTPSDQERKAGRAYTHFLRPSVNKSKKDTFIDEEIAEKYGYEAVDDRADSPVCYEQFCPMLDYFKDKYSNYMDEPFMNGYLVHLVTDDVYFSQVIPAIVEKNRGEIDSYIENTFKNDGYQKKPYLSNGEYLKWSHTTMYQQYGYYNILALLETYKDMPNLYELSTYLKNWEKSNRKFKPSMIEELNDTNSITDFLENSNNSAKEIVKHKEELTNSNIINANISFKGIWPYDLFLDFLDETESEVLDNVSAKKRK